MSRPELAGEIREPTGRGHLPPMSDRSAPTTVSIRDLSARFGNVYALTNISAEVKTGDLVAILGPNGAGKSTLLNAISGLQAGTTTGQIFIDEADVSGPARSPGREPGSVGAFRIRRSWTP